MSLLPTAKSIRPSLARSSTSSAASGGFPLRRLRRTRKTEWIRGLVSETSLDPSQLIWPLFVSDSITDPEPIDSMPGVYRYSVEQAVREVAIARDLGIGAVAVFPRTADELRTPSGDEALNENNLVCRTVRAIKQEIDDIGVVCDVALDPYTDHGHDGLLIDGVVDNDATLEVLVQQSLIQVDAGCDVIAPSDMMDGRIGVIRRALEQRGNSDTLLLSYCAKYASGYYGPFRDAVGVGSRLKGDKRTYQMSPSNRREAIAEAELDIAEGADILMVKPALPYLDIISDITHRFNIPCFAYQVSGEYSAIKAATLAGWLDERTVVMESLTSMRRAGASAILTYFARDVAAWLK